MNKEGGAREGIKYSNRPRYLWLRVQQARLAKMGRNEVTGKKMVERNYKIVTEHSLTP